MLRTLSDEIAVNIKDRLRDMRYAIRRTGSAARAPQHGLPSPEALLGQAANAVDTALTVAETVSISLVSAEPARHRGVPRMRAFGFYFAAGGEGMRAFRSDMYYLFKEILRRRGIGDAPIHEAGFAQIHQRIARRHGVLFAAQAGAASAAAALFLEIMAEYPVRLAASRAGSGEAEIAAAAASLFCALATVKPAEVAEGDALESILLAVAVRHERLAAASEARDVQKLEALFATLIAHLP